MTINLKQTLKDVPKCVLEAMVFIANWEEGTIVSLKEAYKRCNEICPKELEHMQFKLICKDVFYGDLDNRYAELAEDAVDIIEDESISTKYTFEPVDPKEALDKIKGQGAAV